MPTTVEWTRFIKCARRMRELKLNLSEETIPLDVLSALQLCTLNEPLLPNMKILEFREIPADIILSVPLFLSHRTVGIDIQSAIRPPPRGDVSVNGHQPANTMSPYAAHLSPTPTARCDHHQCNF